MTGQWYILDICIEKNIPKNHKRIHVATFKAIKYLLGAPFRVVSSRLRQSLKYNKR